MTRQSLLKLAYQRPHQLSLKNSDYLSQLKLLTLNALKQDLGKTGDITSQAIFPVNQLAQASILSQDYGCLAGIEEICWFYHQLNIQVKPLKKDGHLTKPNDIVIRLSGPIRALLEAERTGLNLLQRMSGIASLTHQLVNKLHQHHLRTLITATRKTPWPLLDKKAVCLGGGNAHRLNLNDAILIKDCHLHQLKKHHPDTYISLALNLAFKYSRRANFIQIEVADLPQTLLAAQSFKQLCPRPSLPCIIMFDNFSPSQIRTTITALKNKRLYNHVLLEASGSINQANLLNYARSGVDALSLGLLTHSAAALNLHQEIVI